MSKPGFKCPVCGQIFATDHATMIEHGTTKDICCPWCSTMVAKDVPIIDPKDRLPDDPNNPWTLMT